MNLQQVLYFLKLAASVIVTAAGTILAASLQGAIVLPASVQAILTSVTAIGAGLGIASGGVAAKPSHAAPVPVQGPNTPGGGQ